MIEWQPIPSEVDISKAPFNGDEVLLYADSATVNVVRLAWWDNGDDEGFGGPEDLGWWSAKHSVTSEHIHDAPGCKWSHWSPFSPPENTS